MYIRNRRGGGGVRGDTKLDTRTDKAGDEVGGYENGAGNRGFLVEGAGGG